MDRWYFRLSLFTSLIKHTQIRRVQMNFMQDIGYNGILEVFRSFQLPIRDRLNSSQSSQFPAAPPSTASTGFTHQSERSNLTMQTTNTAYSTVTNKPGYNSYVNGFPQRQLPTNFYIDRSHMHQNKLFPPITSTTTRIPGPSIAESIVDRPVAQSSRAPAGYHSATAVSSSNFALHPLPDGFGSGRAKPSPSLVSKLDPLRRSLFMEETSIHTGSAAALEQLNQMPPPRRQLPFSESRKARKSKGKHREPPHYSDTKNAEASNSSTADKSGRQWGNSPLAEETRAHSRETSPSPAPPRQSLPVARTAPKARQLSQNRKRIQAKVLKRPASPIEERGTRPAKKAALEKIIQRESKPKQQAAKDSKNHQSKIPTAETIGKKTKEPTTKDVNEIAAPSRKSGAKAKGKISPKPPAPKPATAKASLSPSKAKIAASKAQAAPNPPASKATASKSIPASKAKATKASAPKKASNPILASAGTQTEAVPEGSRPSYATKSTQAHLVTARLQKPTASKATQTDSPNDLLHHANQRIHLTPRSRPVLTDLSPNFSALGSSPSQRPAAAAEAKKKKAAAAPPRVNKFSKPPARHVNKFNRRSGTVAESIE